MRVSSKQQYIEDGGKRGPTENVRRNRKGSERWQGEGPLARRGTGTGRGDDGEALEFLDPLDQSGEKMKENKLKSRIVWVSVESGGCRLVTAERWPRNDGHENVSQKSGESYANSSSGDGEMPPSWERYKSTAHAGGVGRVLRENEE